VRTAHVITGNAADAQDAAQEAFVKAYYALGRFREGASFRPWLLRIVANEAINRRRATRRKSALALQVAEEAGAGLARPSGGPLGVAEGRPSDDAAPSPEAAALAHELRTEMVSALNRLRDEDRLVIAYRFFFDLSEAEMAQSLGCARGTVKSRLSRALKRLQRELPPGMARAEPIMDTEVS